MVRERLSKAERRDQLLETGLEIVRAEGANALTLGHLAERAGVSRPVAYEHFETRQGLLLALYQRLTDRQFERFRRALPQGGTSLAEAAERIGVETMRCYATIGPEAFAIEAALHGYEAMAAVHRGLTQRYVDAYVELLAPFATLSRGEMELRCRIIVAASDTLAPSLRSGALDEGRAAGLLGSLVRDWVVRAEKS